MIDLRAQAHGDIHARAVNLGILASGTGTILSAIIDSGLAVSVVVLDRECGAMGVAERSGIPVELIERSDFGASFDRREYTMRVLEALRSYSVDLVAMAGFGTVLAPEAYRADSGYPGKILNTHPALLPAFKGWHAVEEALAAGVAVTGCTVHIATETVDDGPVLAQEQVPILPGDNLESLHERIKVVERRLYPQVIAQFMAGDFEHSTNTLQQATSTPLSDMLGPSGRDQEVLGRARAGGLGTGRIG
ncbi:MAG: phosphoribosylglycinamide formyltransferase [Actinomycetota bacterium]|nr:phosphoribosylglycinamide formyltransferase [Actinomycetota bacterium]